MPNEGEVRTGMRLQPGLVIALEPMLIAGGGDDYGVDPDGWTIRTADGTRAAHAEHTIAVTADGRHPDVAVGRNAKERPRSAGGAHFDRNPAASYSPRGSTPKYHRR